MTMPKEEHQKDLIQAWGTYLDALEKSLQTLEMEIKEAEQMAGVCTDEWCAATQHYIDDIANALFSIHEPRWSDEADSNRIKKLKRRLHDLYADYRAVYQKVA
jgi:hypothetical protein